MDYSDCCYSTYIVTSVLIVNPSKVVWIQVGYYEVTPFEATGGTRQFLELANAVILPFITHLTILNNLGSTNFLPCFYSNNKHKMPTEYKQRPNPK